MTDIAEEVRLNECDRQDGALEKLEDTVVKIVDDPGLDSKEKAVSITRIMMHESFSGPMPSPRMMAEYEKILPGSAERIITMTEEQHCHRISIEKEVIPKQVKQSGRGQIYALVICILMILFAGYCVYSGANWIAITVIVLAIVTVVGLFITGKHKNKEDLNDKARDN